MRSLIFILFILILAAVFALPPVEIQGVIINECVPFLALLPLIMAAVSAGGQVAGQAAGNQRAGIERKKYENQLQGRIDDLNTWFEGENNKDFLQTDVAQSSIRGLMGNNDRQIGAINNAAVAGGATQEANIAAKGKLNENFSEAIGRLLGYGTQYKQGLRDQYDYRLQSLYQPMDQLSQQKIGDWANFNQNVSNAGNSVSMAAGMIDWEELLGKQTGGMDSGGYGIPNNNNVSWGR
jgi:hypothetical protein